MQVQVRFGSETLSRVFPEGTTIGAIIGDYELKVLAGWGDNVRALVAGVEQSPTAIAPDGGTIVVETRANSKAS